LIPKIIWQTHEYEYDDLPKNYKKCTRTWINLNAGWEYKYYSNENRKKIVQQLDPYLYELFFLEERNSPEYRAGKVHQADIFRYLVVYEFGGVYADMDSIATMPIDYMLESITEDYDMLVENTSKSPYNNAIFAARPKSPALKNIIEKIKESGIYQEKMPPYGHKNPTTNTDYFPHYFPNGSLHEIFSKEAKENPKVIPIFSAGLHSNTFLKNFDHYKPVNYYGKKTTYENIIKELGLSE
jgi:hypothetical protein